MLSVVVPHPQLSKGMQIRAEKRIGILPGQIKSFKGLWMYVFSNFAMLAVGVWVLTYGGRALGRGHSIVVQEKGAACAYLVAMNQPSLIHFTPVPP